MKEKSFDFEIQIVFYCQFLRKESKEFVLSRQLLRSGTAVGALIWEAEYGQSRADFINKMNIALKEANETDYWLDLLKATNYLCDERYTGLSIAITEILKMLIATVNTARLNS